MEEEEEGAAIGLGCALDTFLEKDEILGLINILPNIYLNPKEVEKYFETFQKILDRYQEQPHLLDPVLETLVSSCLNIFTSYSELQLQQLSLKFLRQIFKVRGPKVVVKRMPIEIGNLVKVLEFLERSELDDPKSWETPYVLLHWLSILVMNPFGLKLLDSQLETKKKTVSQRIMDLCFNSLVINSLVGEATSVLLSNFLTRPDIISVHMDFFVSWASDKMCFKTIEFGVRIGAFRSLASLFKHGKREEMLKYGKSVLASLISSDFTQSDTLIRKLGTKLLQRIGIMFMKTKLAPWRYERGSRILLDNLQNKDAKLLKIDKKVEDQEDYSELAEFSNEIESIIDILLNLLKDRDTVVRWSAAKGIGRITNRLPEDFGDEVVESILSTFSELEQSFSWHGGCLAIAELARRGLLLPRRLEPTVAIIKKALLYDEIRGNYSVGGQVRDASCYVLWAFARAFEPQVLEPYVHQVAQSLVNAMLFDREINCRRAASAAFQENVGRLGNFPNGIDIVTLADYYAIGIRRNAFTKVSVEVGVFGDYLRPMVDHLISLKYNYFDSRVRELTAEALANLCPLDPHYIRGEVMGKMVQQTTSTHVATAHGALLTLSQVMTVLHSLNKWSLEKEEFETIRDIVKKILYKQFKEVPLGNIPLREAVSIFIMSASKIGFPVHDDKEILEIWHAVLEDHISFCAPDLREKTSRAFPVFLTEYYWKREDKRAELKRFINIFIKNLASNVLTTRIGYALLLGKLPCYILKDSLKEVVSKLCTCAQINSTIDAEWAEVRREAFLSLANIISSGLMSTSQEGGDWEEGIPIDFLDIDLIFETGLNGMEDYTTDKRGDIGQWVREGAMTLLKVLVLQILKCGPVAVEKHLSYERLKNIIGSLLKQSVEKIDNIRVAATKNFLALLHAENPSLETLPNYKELLGIFPKCVCDKMNWRSSDDSFPLFIKIIELEPYTYSLLSGLLLSGGSLSDSVLKSANNAINNYLEEASIMEIKRVADCFILLFKDNLKKERVTLPLMKFLSQLLKNSYFTPILSADPQSFGFKLLEAVKNENARSNRLEKIIAGVDLLCELLQADIKLAKLSLRKLVVYLCHGYPRVRTVTAEKLYEALMTYSDNFEESGPNYSRGMEILSDTEWSNLDVGALRLLRNEFCEAINIPIPTPSSTNLTN